MDLNISLALWNAANGAKSAVLLSGLGADEMLGGESFCLCDCDAMETIITLTHIIQYVVMKKMPCTSFAFYIASSFVCIKRQTRVEWFHM